MQCAPANRPGKIINGLAKCILCILLDVEKVARLNLFCATLFQNIVHFSIHKSLVLDLIKLSNQCKQITAPRNTWQTWKMCTYSLFFLVHFF